MARLTIASVSKSFGDVHALRDVSLAVEDGEFVAVLGPSGCGKTTLLRLIAGFERPDAGTIAIGDRLVSSVGQHVPPEHRRVGIVFQSYALWPHMSVAQNVGYPLRVAGADRATTVKRVAESLALVGLAGFGERRPAQLSGGQRQRVALARCLIQAPEIVLLDEPLANLDVHLRAAMEAEFADFHRRTRTTMLYITHHQAEAMALADRIAVLSHGRLEQLAPPSRLYREPETEMVAQFIGQGIVVPGEVRSVDAAGTCIARVLGVDTTVRCRTGQRPAANARISLSPRALRVAAADEAGVSARVTRAVYQGGYFQIEAAPLAAPDVRLLLNVAEDARPRDGEAITVAIDDGWVIPSLP
jgi:iron(III) transport system ATP-binding protein